MSTETRRSLVLITVDCLRADHCGFHGYPQPTTPFLNSLAAESLVVPTAIVAGAPTYYSLPAILASRMPLALGRDVIGLAPGEKTLATALHDAGYATAAFSAANPYISRRFGYEQGFDLFQDFLDFNPSPASTTTAPAQNRLNGAIKTAANVVGLGRIYDELYFQYRLRKPTSAAPSMDALRKYPTAEVLVSQAISWLKTAAVRQPFFLWIHFMDPHSPYYPPLEAIRKVTGRDVDANTARYLNEYWSRSDLSPQRLQSARDSVMELYDAGIRCVDDQIERLAEHLRRAGLWENCALVLTADHGEEFLEHGRRYHPPVALHEEITRVPMMIRAPDVAKRQVAETPFSHLHLAPTLLEILGVLAPLEFQGQSLWNNLEQGKPWGELAMIECALGCTNPFRADLRLGPSLLALRGARHKLVMRLEQGASAELFDLADDPEEQKPLSAGKAADIRKGLLLAAFEHLRGRDASREATARVRARLRDLRVELGASHH